MGDQCLGGPDMPRPRPWCFRQCLQSRSLIRLPSMLTCKGLGGVGGYFDAIMERYRQAKADGRISTWAGVEQAIDQLEGHLALSLDDDTLLRRSCRTM